MNTLDQIKGRCRIDEVTECWIWTGATRTSNGGKFLQPAVYAPDFTKDVTGQTMSVQTGGRAVWHLLTGAPITEGHRVFRRSCCSNGLCLNPEHLRSGSMKQWGRSIVEKGEWKGAPSRVAANRTNGRKRSHVTPELVMEILSTEETGRVIAKRLGLTESVISRVRTGGIKSVQAANNPFAGLIRKAA